DVEPLLLRWQRVYPVKTAELADRSVAYFGSPREAMDLIAAKSKPLEAPVPGGIERRSAVRVRIDCQSRYETGEMPAQFGRGRTVDLSGTGACFTTESQLPGGVEVILHVAWPVPLDGNVPVELLAVGKVMRTEATKAAMRLDSMSFSIGSTS